MRRQTSFPLIRAKKDFILKSLCKQRSFFTFQDYSSPLIDQLIYAGILTSLKLFESTQNRFQRGKTNRFQLLESVRISALFSTCSATRVDILLKVEQISCLVVPNRKRKRNGNEDEDGNKQPVGQAGRQAGRQAGGQAARRRKKMKKRNGNSRSKLRCAQVVCGNTVLFCYANRYVRDHDVNYAILFSTLSLVCRDGLLINFQTVIRFCRQETCIHVRSQSWQFANSQFRHTRFLYIYISYNCHCLLPSRTD